MHLTMCLSGLWLCICLLSLRRRRFLSAHEGCGPCSPWPAPCPGILGPVVPLAPGPWPQHPSQRPKAGGRGRYPALQVSRMGAREAQQTQGPRQLRGPGRMCPASLPQLPFPCTGFVLCSLAREPRGTSILPGPSPIEQGPLFPNDATSAGTGHWEAGEKQAGQQRQLRQRRAPGRSASEGMRSRKGRQAGGEG